MVVKMTSSLTRFVSDSRGTLGKLVFDRADSQVLSEEGPIWVLERPWRNNSRSISCIPLGSYVVKPHDSPSKGKCFKVVGVEPDRDEILFHVGNTLKDTEGCLLVGSSVNITQDTFFVGNSRNTLNKMLANIRSRFHLVIGGTSP